MTRQYIALSIVLLISVIINVGFVFDKIASPDEQIGLISTDKAAPSAGGSEEKIGGEVDLLRGVVVELDSIKRFAGDEEAVRTAGQIDKLRGRLLERIKAVGKSRSGGRN